MSSRIDLNLVRVFVSVYESRSVTKAAERLFVSQPTVSYGLSKLRELLKDPLFIKTGEGMMPTQCGERTYQHFSAALAHVENTLDQTRHFDPATSSNRFVIAMSDIGELVYLPALLGRVHREAPNVELAVVQAPTEKIAAQLASGSLDAAIGNLPSLKDEAESVRMFVDRYVCVLRKNHSGISANLTLDKYAAASHIVVSSPFSGGQVIEDALRVHGVSCKVAARVCNFTVLPRLISNTDLLATVPLSLAKLFHSYRHLRFIDLPVRIPELEIRIFWNERCASSEAQKWLRGIIFEELTGSALERWERWLKKSFVSNF